MGEFPPHHIYSTMNIVQDMLTWINRPSRLVRYLQSRRTTSKGVAQRTRRMVRRKIGQIGVIEFAPGLPKTRSGKIMRRILRKIAENEFGTLGKTSTLIDPAVI